MWTTVIWNSLYILSTYHPTRPMILLCKKYKIFEKITSTMSYSNISHRWNNSYYYWFFYYLNFVNIVSSSYLTTSFVSLDIWEFVQGLVNATLINTGGHHCNLMSKWKNWTITLVENLQECRFKFALHSDLECFLSNLWLFYQWK